MGSYALDQVTVVFDDVDRGPSLGTKLELNGKEYRFVKMSDTDSSTVSNVPVVYISTDPSANNWEVSPDVSDAPGGGMEFFAGMLLAAVDTGQYCYVLKEGPCTITLSGTVTAAGDAIIVSEDGGFGPAGATDYPNGIALEDSGSDNDTIYAWIKAI